GPRHRRVVAAPALRRPAPCGDERAGLDPHRAPGECRARPGGHGRPLAACVPAVVPRGSGRGSGARPSRPRTGGSRVKTAVLAESQAQAQLDVPSHAGVVLADVGGRLAAYLALTKPRIAVMVLVTVATGFLLGGRGASHPSTLLLTLVGTGLVAGGA